MYVEGIILDGLHKLNMNRSIFGIYHILFGKKSVQSVQDARLFQLENYYGIYPTLSRAHYVRIFSKMKEDRLIELGNNENHFMVTQTGYDCLRTFQQSSLANYLNGLTYQGKDDLFLLKLYLLVQTYSNLQHNNHSFIPIVDNQEVMNWVKRFYRNHPKTTINERLYTELHHLLSLLSDREAEFFVDRLTGYRNYGMSIEQLATEYELTRDDAYILLRGITHQLMKLVEQSIETYPVLSQFIENDQKRQFITDTASKTYQLLRNNYAIPEIAHMRKLKENTIYDHIIEIALYDTNFPIDSFVSSSEQEEIITIIQQLKTYKLKRIKEHCNDSISYFQIRLVLARWKELLPGEESHD